MRAWLFFSLCVCVCVCMKMYALLCVAQGGHAKAKMRGASLPELILR